MSYQQPQTTIDQQIASAATALIAEVGIQFTIEQLAERASLSRATVYRRIGSKAALLAQLAGAGQEQDVRTRILLAARDVFSQNGLLASTMEQVAERGGVGVATVYRHFGDKDGLVQSFINDWSPQAALQDLMVHPSGDLRADLTLLAETIIPFFHANRDMFRLILFGSAAERAYIDQLRGSADRTRDRLVSYFAAQHAAGRLRGNAQPHELTMAFIGMIVGFVFVGPVHFGLPEVPPERISAVIVETFLTGFSSANQGG